MCSMLDIQLRSLLDQARAAGAPDLAEVPLPVAREIYHHIATSTDLPPAGVAIEERPIDGPAGALALRIYRPRGANAGRGAVLYLHGGGFVLGHPRDYDGLCSNLAAWSGCPLVQVDYRLAPEHPFPAAVEDAWAALEWLAGHAGELGAAADRLIVAGDSAGGNLAAVMALLAQEAGGPRLAQQTLIYPVVAAQPESFDSYRRHGEGPTLTTRHTWHFHALAHGSREAVRDFRAAPLLAEDLAGLPPALVQVAGFDPLRDEGIAYAERLTGAGVPVTLVEYSGLAHGYLSMGGAVDAARLAVVQVAECWRDTLSR
jgi:acetyl esterase